MKLLFVTPIYAPYVSGATTFVAAMARRCVERGDRVTVLTTGAARPEQLWKPPPSRVRLPRQETIGGAEVVRLDLAYARPSPYAFAALRRLGHSSALAKLPSAAQLRALTALGAWMPRVPQGSAVLDELISDADLAHVVESSWDGLFTSAASTADRFRKPTVLTPLMHLGDERIAAHFRMAHQVRAYRNAAAVLALSSREREAYEQLGVDPTRLRTLAMGVDLPAADPPDPEARKAWRHQLNIEGPLVAFLGANTYDKGAHTLALAAAELNRSGTVINVAFAGPQSEELIRFLEARPEVRAALAGRLRILGFLDEPAKRALLSACDLLALPSQVDSFGIVLLEAWLHGKPVIGAAAGGIPDLVRDGETGLLVPFGDAAALAAAIARLVSHPDLASRLGSAGQGQVLARYTWDATFSALESIYCAALAAPLS